MTKRTYNQEEVDAILDRAIRAQAKDGTRLTHEELVSAAAEVGIPRDAIDAAARDGAAALSDERILATWKRRARLGFLRHFITYVLVIAMLAFINMLTTPAFPWFGIVALGWGIGIAMHFMGTFFADEERVLERERRRAEKRARRERWRKRGESFEIAVNQGVRALIEMANQNGARIEVPRNEVRIDTRDELDHVSEEEETSAARRGRRR
jgi:hypothetical protein